MKANPIHPDLRAAIRFMPQVAVTAATLWVMRLLTPLFLFARATPGVTTRVERVGNVPVRMHRPEKLPANAPALLWIHGGGHVLGTARMDDTLCTRHARDLGMLVVAPDYRLAPEHPFPADLDDCHAALQWLYTCASELGIDRNRIVVGGASAGGVDCTLLESDGACHGFDLWDPKSLPAQDFYASQVAAMRRALSGQGPAQAPGSSSTIPSTCCTSASTNCDSLMRGKGSASQRK